MADAPIDADTTDAGDHPTLPVRIVVTDDLERSRSTVFFRLILAIPHLIVVALWGIAAALVSIIIWIALVFEGRAPASLHRFVVSYVRYAVQVSGYLHIAAAPWPRFGGSDGYPIDVELDVARRQSRRSVLPRLFLALPVFLLAAAIGGGVWFGDASWTGSNDSAAAWSVGASAGGLAATAAFLAWFASVAKGRTPRGLRDLAVYGIAYTAQVSSYLLLITDVYPSTDPNRVLPTASLPAHPVRLRLTDRLERSRLTVFFRLLLALPHIIWLLLWSVVALLLSIVVWVVALATGRVPAALHRFLAAWVRYGMHVGAFLFLVGGPFPGFVGAAGSYPVDLEIDPPQPQRRVVTLFRFFLAHPRAPPRVRVHGRRLRRGVPRLVGGARSPAACRRGSGTSAPSASATRVRRTRTSSSSRPGTRTRCPPCRTGRATSSSSSACGPVRGAGPQLPGAEPA